MKIQYLVYFYIRCKLSIGIEEVSSGGDVGKIFLRRDSNCLFHCDVCADDDDGDGAHHVAFLVSHTNGQPSQMHHVPINSL